MHVLYMPIYMLINLMTGPGGSATNQTRPEIEGQPITKMHASDIGWAVDLVRDEMREREREGDGSMIIINYSMQLPNLTPSKVVSLNSHSLSKSTAVTETSEITVSLSLSSLSLSLSHLHNKSISQFTSRSLSLDSNLQRQQQQSSPQIKCVLKKKGKNAVELPC